MKSAMHYNIIYELNAPLLSNSINLLSGLHKNHKLVSAYYAV